MLSPYPVRARHLAPIAVAAIASSAALAGDWPASNVSLYSHVPVSELEASYAEDCWGYVSPSGREYAIVGVSVGTAFVEITNPSEPVVVEVIHTPNRGRDMKVYGHHVYSSSDSGPLHAIDVSDIDSGNVTLVNTIGAGTHNLFVNEDSGYLYLAIGGPLHIYDLSDPANPAFAGEWGGQTHDVQVVTYTEGPYAGREIAFASAGWDGLLDIVDVTDKSSTFLVGSVSYPDATYSHQGWLSSDRTLFYHEDEVDGIQRTNIFNVEDLSAPELVGQFSSTVPTATDHNLYVHDGFIYEANYASGMRVFNACDPLAPVEVGFFDTYPDSDAPGYDGAWTAYPFFPSGTVIISDRSSGLFVVDVSAAIGNGCASDCPEDLDGSGAVDVNDLLAVLGGWGTDAGDVTGDGTTDVADLLAVLGAWGPCA